MSTVQLELSERAELSQAGVPASVSLLRWTVGIYDGQPSRVALERRSDASVKEPSAPDRFRTELVAHCVRSFRHPSTALVSPRLEERELALFAEPACRHTEQSDALTLDLALCELDGDAPDHFSEVCRLWKSALPRDRLERRIANLDADG